MSRARSRSLALFFSILGMAVASSSAHASPICLADDGAAGGSALCTRVAPIAAAGEVPSGSFHHAELAEPPLVESGELEGVSEPDAGRIVLPAQARTGDWLTQRDLRVALGSSVSRGLGAR